MIKIAEPDISKHRKFEILFPMLLIVAEFLLIFILI
jgi:hypothetical protein